MNRLRLIVFGVAVAACGGRTDDSPSAEAADLCARTVRHVAIGIYPEAMAPKGSELRVVEAVVAGATVRCRSEGLSQKQADCLLAASIDDHMAAARDCLGPRERWPSWFSGSGVHVGSPAR